ncbi:tryptophanase leader peptide [Vibrio sp. 99-8-1]|nr:tryptophanase leader peptide [Vibrio sp. 99-8-1]
MNLYLRWQSYALLTLLAWYNVDHRLSFDLPSFY